jgi:hypothetical protein
LFTVVVYLGKIQAAIMPHFKALEQNGEERLASRIGFCISAPKFSLIENNEGLFFKLELHPFKYTGTLY